MKPILTTAIVAMTAVVVLAEDRTIPERVRGAAGAVAGKTREVAGDTKDAVVGAAKGVGRATRTGWQKTKAFFSEDLPVYHEGAGATLTGLNREIAELKARTPSSAPNYFRTRLVALDEQHAYLSKQLALLTREQLANRTSGPRSDFDRGITDLEGAIDQAQDGADTIGQILLK